MTVLGISKRMLVQRLGFQNVSKGLRRLTVCIQQGACTHPLLKNLATALEVEQVVIDEAIRQTTTQVAEQQRQEAVRCEIKARQRFQPYIYVQSESHRPSFITGAAVMGMKMKYLEVPNMIAALPLEEQLPHIQALIRWHYHETGGDCVLFGRITGFVYRWSFDESVAFAINGTVTNRNNGRFHEDGVASARIGNTPLTLDVHLL
jgi:hypothetical protein